MAAGNGSGPLATAAVPIVVGGQHYRCPGCGNRPRNTHPGVPEAMMTVLPDEPPPPVFLCLPCFQRWQIAEFRQRVPALVPIKEDE